MTQAIKDAWELVEIIGMFGIILLVLLTIAPLALVLWVISGDKRKKEKENE